MGSLKAQYRQLESDYYALLDRLERRFDVYFIVTPLERFGLPTFPVFAFCLMAIFAGLLFFVPMLALRGTAVSSGVVSSMAPSVQAALNYFERKDFTLYVQDAEGNPVDSAVAYVVAGNSQIAQATSVGGVAVFPGLPVRRLVFVVGSQSRVFDLTRRQSGIITVGNESS